MILQHSRLTGFIKRSLCTHLAGCRAGKELAMAAKQEEELRLKRIVEERQRERDEEARAREKIRIKLGKFWIEERMNLT